VSGDGRIAALAVERSASGDRLVLRTGTQAGLGRPTVLDRASRYGIDSPELAVTDARTLAAWRRLSRVTRVIAFSSVARGGAPNRPTLWTAGQTTHDPRFVTPAYLTWNTDRRAYVRAIGSGRGLETDRLPPGAVFDAALAVDGDGTLVVAWPQNGRILAAQRPAGGAFGAPVVLSDGPGYARAPALAVTRSGAVVAAWVQNAAAGNAVLTASRPRDGAFGAAREVVAAAKGALVPHTIATADGGVVLTYVATGSRVGWEWRGGTVHALALTPDGTPAGRDLTLSDAGERAYDASLGADASAAWIAWASGGSVHVRRLAPGGVLGRVRTVSAGDDARAALAPDFAMTRSGRALLAYARRDNHLRYVVRTAGL
jgi:hypothetical protein